MIGDWDEVSSYVDNTTVQSSPVVIARALLALRNGDASALTASLSVARKLLGSPVTAAGSQGYRRGYEAVLDLHLLHELEVIDSIAKRPEGDRFLFSELSNTLSLRLDATLPTFRIREPILSMRRTAFGLRYVCHRIVSGTKLYIFQNKSQPGFPSGNWSYLVSQRQDC